MGSLVVLAFEEAEGAEGMRDRMFDFQRRGLITLEDAAIVVRKENGHLKVKQATSLVGVGALGGAFWGVLIGLLFVAPWLGLIAGTAVGSLVGKLGDLGIDDEFVKEVGETIRPGHSALFLWARDAQLDRLRDELGDVDFTIVKTDLSPDDETNLRDALAAEGVVG